MKVQIDSLFAADKTPLSKKFLLDEGVIKPISYPHVRTFNSVRTKISGIEGLAHLVSLVGQRKGCLLKGLLDGELRAQSRAGHTLAGQSTQWICLDIDGLRGVDTVQDFIRLLPEVFRTTSHVIQYSSSMGIVDKGLSAHVFFLIQKPVPAPVIKRWLMYQNLTIPHLMARLALTRSRVAMRYPLDVTTCQNDKLIYVAPAIRTPGVIDTFKEERVQVVNKRYVALKYSFEVADDINVEQLALDEMNRIRENAGLEKQTHDTTKIGKVEVLKDVTSHVAVTGVKRERGFTYLNLNGGDSWGYYHGDDNPKILYNFKGEPNLDIQSVLPEYYEQCVNVGAELLEHVDDGGEHSAVTVEHSTDALQQHDGEGEGSDENTQPDSGVERVDRPWITLVGIEDHSGGYFGVRYQPSTSLFFYTSIAQRIQVKDYCSEFGIPTPDRLNRWRVGYDFQDYSYKINNDARFINLYDPPTYVRNDSGVSESNPPELISTVLRHVVGGDAEAYELFLNWLACVVQFRKSIGTAWLLSGTQGTGKGLFFTHIMMPILGRDYVSRATLPMFEKEFNSFLEHSLLIFVDEIRLKELKQASVALSNLKQYITEDVLPVRKMRTDPFLVDNHANFVFASNHYDSMEIDPSDRRFLVAPRQEEPLSSVVSLEGIDTRIRGELEGFAQYLCGRTADIELARSMYHSSERQRLKHLTRNASDEVADALRAGDFEFFLDEAPNVDKPGEAAIQAKLPEPISYSKFLKLVMESPDNEVNIPRDMLRMVWWHITGAWFLTPTKFSKFVGKMGLQMKKIRVGETTIAGLHHVQFNVTDQSRQEYVRWLARQKEHLSPVQTTSSISKNTAPSSE
jgi:hypothetical protein